MKTIFTGPLGGQFYFTSTGTKVYVTSPGISGVAAGMVGVALAVATATMISLGLNYLVDITIDLLALVLIQVVGAKSKVAPMITSISTFIVIVSLVFGVDPLLYQIISLPEGYTWQPPTIFAAGTPNQFSMGGYVLNSAGEIQYGSRMTESLDLLAFVLVIAPLIISVSRYSYSKEFLKAFAYFILLCVATYKINVHLDAFDSNMTGAWWIMIGIPCIFSGCMIGKGKKV